jgi:hypothetical protein
VENMEEFGYFLFSHQRTTVELSAINDRCTVKYCIGCRSCLAAPTPITSCLVTDIMVFHPTYPIVATYSSFSIIGWFPACSKVRSEIVSSSLLGIPVSHFSSRSVCVCHIRDHVLMHSVNIVLHLLVSTVLVIHAYVLLSGGCSCP